MSGHKKKDIHKVIGSILGNTENDDIDYKSAYVKYNSFKETSNKYINLLKLLLNSGMFLNADVEADILSNYIEVFTAEHTNIFKYNTDSYIYEKYPIITPEETTAVKEFISVYVAAKNSSIVTVLLSIYNTLLSHNMYIGDKDKLDDHFITKTSSNKFTFIPELNVNFKWLYIRDSISDETRRYFLNILHKIYIITDNLSKVYEKPDIDPNKFVEIVEHAIGELKKKIPRCNDAFDKILKSTMMLRDNYGEYYKDYIVSKNTMIIAENFIIDVSNSLDSKSVKMAFQFKKIIRELKSMTSKASGDPKVKAMLDMLTSQAEKVTDSVADGTEEADEDDEAEGVDEAEGADETEGAEAEGVDEAEGTDNASSVLITDKMSRLLDDVREVDDAEMSSST